MEEVVRRCCCCLVADDGGVKATAVAIKATPVRMERMLLLDDAMIAEDEIV